MDRLGPFEAAPVIAVAVSGGADSMALCLLTRDWVRPRGGRVVALTVDHGLRRGSAEEARQVARWMKHRGIEHHVLRWRGAKPSSGVQAAARAARYDLMTSWARAAGILHLALAHNQEDQAETFLLRLGRGSGVDGLAAMAAVTETAAVRLLRPLLGVPHAALRATLEAKAQDWLEDPSNRDPSFARTHIREAWPALSAAGLSAAGFAEAARRFGRARRSLEVACAELLAACCWFHPAGFARLDRARLLAAPEEISLRTLGRVVMTVGGRIYPPRLQKLERLHRTVASGMGGTGATLAGCRVVADRRGLLVCRETRGLPGPIPAKAGASVVWDGRFAIDLVGRGASGAWLAPLGDDGWAETVAERPEARRIALPPAVRPTLPALRDRRGILAVPHLKYERRSRAAPGVAFGRIAFCPPNSASGRGFALV